MQSSIRIAALSALLALAGCGADPETLILGQWKGSGLKQTSQVDDEPERRADLHIGFFDDASCTFRIDTKAPFLSNMPTLACRWTITDERLKLEIRFPDGDIIAETFIMRLDGDELELRDAASGETIILARQDS